MRIRPSYRFVITLALVAATWQGRAFAGGVVGDGTPGSCTDAALNAALVGGGLVTFNCGSPVTIDVSTGTGTKTITAGTTIDGGGLVTISGGSATNVFSTAQGVDFTVRNLTIANGNGQVTGGAIGARGPLTVTNSTFADNHSTLFGGAIFTLGELTVTNCTFSGNRADNSGGAIAADSTLAVANSTFIGNRVDSSNGGAAISTNGTTTITNSTFTGNVGGTLDVSPDGTLQNTIVANTVGGAANCNAPVIDGGHNLDDGTSCGFSAANGSLSSTTPQLDPAGLRSNGGPTQTVALCTAVGVPSGCTAASPAINAGDASICTMAPVSNLDQRGFVRPGIGSAHCSMGAYEANATCIGDCDGTGSVTVTQIITLVNIALGNSVSCPHGVPAGRSVDVAVIIIAVNHVLAGCGS